MQIIDEVLFCKHCKEGGIYCYPIFDKVFLKKTKNSKKQQKNPKICF
jgi:hypothetical protein